MGRLTMTNSVKIATVLESSPLTFPEILERTGIKYAAARSAINVLMRDGMIASLPTKGTGKMGRPLVRYAIQEIL
jgi:predicted ArsR family transcriptional regulator